MITFQEETLDKVKGEITGLLQKHWEEIALNKDVIKLDPDWKGYQAMWDAGILHILTVRQDGNMVGYYVSIVAPHLHYQKSLTSYSDIFYLLPEFRVGLTGFRMLQAHEKIMKGKGVQKIFAMEKLDHPIAGLWKRLGYRHIENVYSKVI